MGVLRNQARRLLAAPFVLEGAEVLRDPIPRAKEFAPTVHRLSARDPRLPESPESLARLQGALAVTGGALLLLGRAPRTACALLAVQALPTVLVQLRDARSDDPGDRSRRGTDAVRDLSLLGALVLAATEPKKRPSHLRWEARHAVRRLRSSTRRRPHRKPGTALARPRR